jgi:hypothetical protein
MFPWRLPCTASTATEDTHTGHRSHPFQSQDVVQTAKLPGTGTGFDIPFVLVCKGGEHYRSDRRLMMRSALRRRAQPGSQFNKTLEPRGR